MSEPVLFQDRLRALITEARILFLRLRTVLDGAKVDSEALNDLRIAIRGLDELWRYLPVRLGGLNLAIPTDALDSWAGNPEAFIAKALGISVEDAHKYVRHVYEARERGCSRPYLVIPCKMVRCPNTRGESFDDPAGMQRAYLFHDAGLWFCHKHRKEAWRTQGLLSDHVVAALGVLDLNKEIPLGWFKTIQVTKNDLQFLVEIGLVTDRRTGRPRPLRVYYSITEAGHATLLELRRESTHLGRLGAPSGLLH